MMRETGDYSRNSIRLLPILFLAALLLGIGFLIGRWSAPDRIGSSEVEGSPDSLVDPGDRVGPRTLAGGVPVGYERSESGAIQAALNYVRAVTPGPGESQEEYETKLRAIASSDWGEELETTIESWPEGEGEVAALRIKLNQYSPERANVALWIAGVVNPRDGAPGAVWGRSFISLVWEQGDWKVAGEDGDAGPWPAPLAGPSSSQELMRLLEGFQSFDYEPVSEG